MSDRPRILVFTGTGKGKTTAALGMALRAAGHGLGVRIIQFIKGDAKTGELAACRLLPNVIIEQCGMGFVPSPQDPRFALHQDAAQKALSKARDAVASGAALIIIDELCTAVAKGLVDESQVLALLEEAKSGQTVVLTGRGATLALIERADTASEIVCLKHGLQSGITAQMGVEF